ncbi:MAG: sulfatase [Planctomycetota bacterium]
MPRLLALIVIASASVAAARPNILLILADDLGWRDLGVTGSQSYQTPAIDALFRSGVHFETGYASCSVCSPTRASLLTGKAPDRHGITQWIGAPDGAQWNRNTPVEPPGYIHALPHDDVTLAEALSEAGYRCGFFGKWHLGGEGSLPTDHGFALNVGGHHNGSPPGGYFAPYQNPELPDGPPGEELPMRLARETAAFVEAATQEVDAPFFAMLSFHLVHGPLQTTRERWEANRIELLATLQPRRRFTFDRTLPVRQTQDNPAYAGMVEMLDDAVATTLAALDAAGVGDETIVVFTSDNGGVSCGDHRGTSNAPLRGGKGRQFEGGTRVPLAIAWAGSIAPGRVVTKPAITTDLYPTLLELCGLPLRPEQHADGVSLAGVMRGEPFSDRVLFWHYPHYSNQGAEPSSVAVHGPWKLIRYHENGREELYRLDVDPGETRDVADEHPPQLRSLAARLDERLAETKAKMPNPNPRFDAAERAAELRRRRTEGLASEERNAAAYLDPDWSPGPGWWGSEPHRRKR